MQCLVSQFGFDQAHPLQVLNTDAVLFLVISYVRTLVRCTNWLHFGQQQLVHMRTACVAICVCASRYVRSRWPKTDRRMRRTAKPQQQSIVSGTLAQAADRCRLPIPRARVLGFCMDIDQIRCSAPRRTCTHTRTYPHTHTFHQYCAQ